MSMPVSAPANVASNRASASTWSRLASNSAARLTADPSATASSSSVRRSSSPSRSSSALLMTESAATGRSPANSGTQMWERSPTAACSRRLMRGSSSVRSMRRVSRAAIACWTIDSEIRRRLPSRPLARPAAAPTSSSPPSMRLTIPASAPVSAIERATISSITPWRSTPAAAMSRCVATMRSSRSLLRRCSSWASVSAAWAIAADRTIDSTSRFRTSCAPNAPGSRPETIRRPIVAPPWSSGTTANDRIPIVRASAASARASSSVSTQRTGRPDRIALSVSVPRALKRAGRRRSGGPLVAPVTRSSPSSIVTWAALAPVSARVRSAMRRIAVARSAPSAAISRCSATAERRTAASTAPSGAVPAVSPWGTGMMDAVSGGGGRALSAGGPPGGPDADRPDGPTCGRTRLRPPVPRLHPAAASRSGHGAPPPDRRLRWRRVLDGAGKPAARRLRARAHRRRAAARVLRAHRLGRRRPLHRPVLPRLPVVDLRAVARLAVPPRQGRRDRLRRRRPPARAGPHLRRRRQRRVAARRLARARPRPGPAPTPGSAGPSCAA